MTREAGINVVREMMGKRGGRKTQRFRWLKHFRCPDRRLRGRPGLCGYLDSSRSGRHLSEWLRLFAALCY